MKTQRELNNSKEKVENKNLQHLELSEDELGLVSGGEDLEWKPLDEEFNNLLIRCQKRPTKD